MRYNAKDKAEDEAYYSRSTWRDEGEMSVDLLSNQSAEKSILSVMLCLANPVASNWGEEKEQP